MQSELAYNKRYNLPGFSMLSKMVSQLWKKYVEMTIQSHWHGDCQHISMSSLSNLLYIYIRIESRDTGVL